MKDQDPLWEQQAPLPGQSLWDVLPIYVLDEALERLVYSPAQARIVELENKIGALLPEPARQLFADYTNARTEETLEAINLTRRLWPEILRLYRPPGQILTDAIDAAGVVPWAGPRRLWKDDDEQA